LENYTIEIAHYYFLWQRGYFMMTPNWTACGQMLVHREKPGQHLGNVRTTVHCRMKKPVYPSRWRRWKIRLNIQGSDFNCASVLRRIRNIGSALHWAKQELGRLNPHQQTRNSFVDAPQCLAWTLYGPDLSLGILLIPAPIAVLILISDLEFTFYHAEQLCQLSSV